MRKALKWREGLGSGEHFSVVVHWWVSANKEGGLEKREGWPTAISEVEAGGPAVVR